MVSNEPTTEPEAVMVSSPRQAPHQLALTLSSPPTPSFDSQPSGPSSPPLTPSCSSPDFHHLALASSLMNLLDEREEEFHYTFGHLMKSVERLRRENAKKEGVIKFKRDSMVMLDNLIRMEEKDVEKLKTLVSTAKADGQKALPMPVSEADLACTQNTAVSPPKVFSRPNMTPKFAANIPSPLPRMLNGSHQLQCAPTSLSLRPFHTLSAQSHLAMSHESNSVTDEGVSRTGEMPARKVATVEKKASGEDYKKMKFGAGDIPGWKMAKGDIQVSRAGEVPVKKMAKVVSSEPEEEHTSSVVSMVSTVILILMMH